MRSRGCGNESSKLRYHRDITEPVMGQILVGNLDDAVIARLKARGERERVA